MLIYWPTCLNCCFQYYLHHKARLKITPVDCSGVPRARDSIVKARAAHKLTKKRDRIVKSPKSFVPIACFARHNPAMQPYVLVYMYIYIKRERAIVTCYMCLFMVIYVCACATPEVVRHDCAIMVLPTRLYPKKKTIRQLECLEGIKL